MREAPCVIGVVHNLADHFAAILFPQRQDCVDRRLDDLDRRDRSQPSCLTVYSDLTQDQG